MTILRKGWYKKFTIFSCHFGFRIGLIHMVLATALLAIHALSIRSVPLQSRPPGQQKADDWNACIAKGLVPYRQLKVSDFRIDDSVPSKSAIYTRGFINYSYEVKVLPAKGERSRATILWSDVKSGLNLRETWRRSTLRNPERFLDHEQGHLIINEISGRQLSQFLSDSALYSESSLPSLAVEELEEKITAGYKRVAERNEREQSRYDRATRSGIDLAAQARWSEILRKDLESGK